MKPMKIVIYKKGTIIDFLMNALRYTSEKLSIRELLMLHHVYIDHGAAATKELFDLLNVSESSITVSTNKLEKLDLIMKAKLDRDKRRVYILPIEQHIEQIRKLFCYDESYKLDDIVEFLEYVNDKYKEFSIELLIILYNLYTQKDKAYSIVHYANLLEFSKPRTSKLIDNILYKPGLIVKHPSRVSKKLIEISLSDKGVELAKDIFEQRY